MLFLLVVWVFFFFFVLSLGISLKVSLAQAKYQGKVFFSSSLMHMEGKECEELVADAFH